MKEQDPKTLTCEIAWDYKVANKGIQDVKHTDDVAIVARVGNVMALSSKKTTTRKAEHQYVQDECVTERIYLKNVGGNMK